MTTTKQWIAASVLGAGAVVALLSWLKHHGDEGPAPPAPAASTSVAAASPAGSSTPGDLVPRAAPLGWPALTTSGGQGSPVDHVAPPVFKARADGHLAIDMKTRVDIERVTALYARDDALATLEQASRNLPAAAQREVQDLYQRYVQYNQAVAQALQPGTETGATLDEAQRQLKTLQTLRAQYFGSEAGAMFQDEEAMQQQLLDDAAEAMRTRRMSQDEALGYAQEKLAREKAAAASAASAPR